MIRTILMLANVSIKSIACGNIVVHDNVERFKAYKIVFSISSQNVALWLIIVLSVSYNYSALQFIIDLNVFIRLLHCSLLLFLRFLITSLHCSS